LASTKCGSSVGLARVVRSMCSPPISLAMEAISGVVATTFNFASALVVSSDRMDKNVNINFIKLEFVGTMSSKQEFELEPDRVFVAKMLAVVVIVLEADF